MILGILSFLVVLGSLAALVQKDTTTFIQALIIAFLISPYGLPKIALWVTAYIEFARDGTTSHPFTGLLICADCGGKLSYREPAEHKEKKYDSDYSFVCQHYRHRKGTCSMHYIKVKTVNEILLKSIKEITDFAKEEKQEFLKVMNKLSDEKREEKYQDDKTKLEKLSSRNEEPRARTRAFSRTFAAA